MKRCPATSELCDKPTCQHQCSIQVGFTYRKRVGKKSVAQGKRDAKKARNKLREKGKR